MTEVQLLFFRTKQTFASCRKGKTNFGRNKKGRFSLAGFYGRKPLQGPCIKKNRAEANGLTLFRWEAMKTVIRKTAIMLPIC
jgi:hypothetical protein